MNSTERYLPEDKLRDLIERLRHDATHNGNSSDWWVEHCRRVHQAADALVTIRAERDAAVAALKPFANWPGHRPAAADETAVWTVTVHSKEQSGLTFADFRAARAIAGEQKNDA